MSQMQTDNNDTDNDNNKNDNADNKEDDGLAAGFKVLTERIKLVYTRT